MPLCIEAHTHGKETQKIKWGRRTLTSFQLDSFLVDTETLDHLPTCTPIRQPHFDVDFYGNDQADNTSDSKYFD